MSSGVMLFVFASVAAIFVLGPSVRADLDSDYTNSAYLDESKTYKLYWKINNEKKSIQFAARVKTLGWVGFGISSGNGNMVGSDVVIAWVSDNKGYLKDRYADAKALPPIDEKQDYTLIAARESNGETIVQFSRLWNTCDDKDNKIKDGTVRVVYAYHTDDPTSENDIPQHSVRGAGSLVLLNILTSIPNVPDDTPFFELRQHDTAVPDSDTTYYCQSYEFPQFPTKKHVVKIEPFISSGNDRVVRSMLVYECTSDFPSSDLGVNGPCYAFNMANSVRMCASRSFVISSWGIGGGTFYFPNHTGFAVGAGIGPRYVVLEIHYDNPEKKSEIKDSSGLRFYYTDKLRKYDAGILWAGWGITSIMVIPPYQQQWVSTGYCSGVCTKIGFQNSSLPDKGINIFATLLRSRLLGTGFTTRHVRNGIELPEIARDDHYDFNYQEFHVAKKEIHVVPGDDIIVDCKYQSKDKTRPVTGGFWSFEEMCISFLYYYPKVELNKCRSINDGWTNFIDKNFMVNGTPIEYPPAQWTQNMTDELKESYDKNPTIQLLCMNQASVPSPVNGNYTAKPVIRVPYTKPDDICPTPRPPLTTTKPVDDGNAAGRLTTTKPVDNGNAAGRQTAGVFCIALATFIGVVLNTF